MVDFMANIKNKKDMTKCNIKILMATSVLCVFFNGVLNIYGMEGEDNNLKPLLKKKFINEEYETPGREGNLGVDLKNKRKIICNCIPYTNPKGNISICCCFNYCNDPDCADWADWEEEEDDDSFLNKKNEKYEYIRNLYPKGFQNEYFQNNNNSIPVTFNLYENKPQNEYESSHNRLSLNQAFFQNIELQNEDEVQNSLNLNVENTDKFFK